MATADPSLAPTVAAFRQFNRDYTRFLGTLNDHYLHTEFSLVEGRVLYELATHSRLQAKEIAESLGLDAGYLSRILAKFTKAGLVTRTTAKDDRRAANLQITEHGRAVVRTLNLRADRQATGVLKKLSAAQRTEFSRARNTVEQIVLDRAPTASSIVLRNHRAGDMGMVVHLEGAGYVEQFGWDNTFEALAARIVADFLERFDSLGDHLKTGHLLSVQNRPLCVDQT